VVTYERCRTGSAKFCPFLIGVKQISHRDVHHTIEFRAAISHCVARARALASLGLPTRSTMAADFQSRALLIDLPGLDWIIILPGCANVYASWDAITVARPCSEDAA
jgi:hypothetical protein